MFNFKHLTIENGLSQSSISCILKDSNGFMWFGTEDGLNKYDGTNFTIYRHDPDKQESLSSSYINTIVEEKDGYIWIGTKHGLNYFNPVEETFTRFYHNPKDSSSLSHNEVNSLLLNKQKELIIGTANGLNKYIRKKEFLKYKIATKSSSVNIISLSQDKDGALWVLGPQRLEKITLKKSIGKVIFKKKFKTSVNYTMFLDSLNLWIGNSQGVVKYNLRSKIFNTHTFYNPKSLKDKRNSTIAITNNNYNGLYIGTLEGGLISFDTITNKFNTTIYDPNNNSALNSNSIRSLYIDNNNLFWVGTYGGGINKHDPNQYKFKHYTYASNGKNSLSESTVRSILKDTQGNIWVGTHGGLNRIDSKTNSIAVYKYDDFNDASISSNTVRALREDSEGVIWAGTWENGLNSFNKKTNTFTRYISLPNSLDTIGPVQALAIDKQDNIWIGGRGLRRFNKKTKTHKSYFYSKNKDSISYNIHSLFFDRKESLWIGTNKNGLLNLNVVSGKIKKFIHKPKDTLSIADNYITSIAEDRKGHLWIGTYGGGLNRLDTETGNFVRYNTNKGLLNNVIYGVIIDKKGAIWFSSNEGLSKMDPKTYLLTHYGIDHGIQSKEFNAGAYYKSNDGELFFGGINGVNSFYPSMLTKKNQVSKIVFTNFQLLDKERLFTSKQLFGKSISRLKRISLKYYQNNFTLKFSELNYSNNVNTIYEYQLKGLSNNWNNLNKQKTITLGNLKSGNYTITVRAQNQHNKYATLDFTISSPYWKTNWAYLLYTCLFFTLLLFIYKNMKKNLRLKKEFELRIRDLEEDLITSNRNKNTIVLQSNDNLIELSIDEKFLHRATEIVENHLTESNFDVQKFADEVFLSKSQLYRKLKRITGCSTTEFIRLIRLKKAAQLLRANSATVSEIAYNVGFDNVGYFSKCFKEFFGTSPSQYNN